MEKMVEEGIQKRLQDMMPFFNQQNDTTHDSLVSAEKATIEARFGEGTWEAEIEPLFEREMADLRKTNGQALSNPKTIKAAVSGIMGHKIDELGKRKAELATNAATARDVEDQRVWDGFRTNGMTGGSAPAPSTTRELTETEKDYQRTVRASGRNMTDDDIYSLRKSAQRDGSLESYQAAQKANGAAQ